MFHSMEVRLAASAASDKMLFSSTLQLFDNPLDYLPELSPCTSLRSLSVANVRIMADFSYTR